MNLVAVLRAKLAAVGNKYIFKVTGVVGLHPAAAARGKIFAYQPLYSALDYALDLGLVPAAHAERRPCKHNVAVERAAKAAWGNEQVGGFAVVGH